MIHEKTPSRIEKRFKQLLEFTDGAIFWSQFVVAGSAVLFLVLAVFPPTREYLARVQHADSAQLISEAVCVDIFLVLVILLLSQRVTIRLLTEVRLLTPQFADIVKGGVNAAYPHIEEQIEAITSAQERRLEVLGLTLKTAWPYVSSWIDNGRLNKWTIVLYCLDPDYVAANVPVMPSWWVSSARAQKESIEAFQKQKAQLLADNHITMELKLYSNFPALNGFRLGNGDLFYAVTRWEEESGEHLDVPHSEYFWIRRNDRSSRAAIHRATMDNWLRKANATSH